MTINFTILGEVKGKKRPKISTFGGFARAYNPKENTIYENKVLNEFKQVAKDIEYPAYKECPIFVTITAYFSLAKSDYGKLGLNKSGREKIESGYCTKHLDADNIAKIILDGLNGVAYTDDKQVVGLCVIKRWTTDNERVDVCLEDVKKGG